MTYVCVLGQDAAINFSKESLVLGVVACLMTGTAWAVSYGVGKLKPLWDTRLEIERQRTAQEQLRTQSAAAIERTLPVVQSIMDRLAELETAAEGREARHAKLTEDLVRLTERGQVLAEKDDGEHKG